MQQSKFSLTPPLTEFVSQYKVYGFKDKSALIQAALLRLKEELELQKLRQSANLYAEIYEADADLQEITQTAIDGWPE